MAPPRFKEEIVQFSVYLPRSEAEGVQAIADRRGCSKAQVVREMVLAGLKRDALVERLADAVDSEHVAAAV